jgi:small-conductance mechanosensitive channel
MDVERIIQVAVSVGVFGVFLISGLFFKKRGYKFLLRLAKATKWRADDVFVLALKNHVFFWSILLGIYFSTLLLQLPPEIQENTHKVLTVFFIVSVTLAFAQIISGLIKAYSHKLQATVAMSGLTQSISRIVIFVLGGLMILNSLGISITPLITTLGIGGLAVALALQDTLSNLFSGFHIILAKQIQIGDYIKLDTGQEGYVVDINWRTTKLRMLPNNIVLVPNSKLSQVIVTNYYLPLKEMSILVEVGIHYESDLEAVEKLTLEVAREVINEVEGAVIGFEPFLRYHTFGDFSINFTVFLRAKEFFDGYKVKHEFIKRLHRKYNEKGVVIPFPITALNVTQEQTAKFISQKK